MEFTANQWADVFTNLIAVIIAVTLRAAAQAYTAKRFGDSTAEQEGRLTLNPSSHIDAIGTILIPVIGSFMGSGHFGWGREIPRNERKLKNPDKDSILIAISGPATHLICSFVFILLYIGAQYFFQIEFTSQTIGGAFSKLFITSAKVNAILAFFNMIPLRPLDGAIVIEKILPDNMLKAYEEYVVPNSMILLLIILIGGSRVISGAAHSFLSIALSAALSLFQ